MDQEVKSASIQWASHGSGGVCVLLPAEESWTIACGGEKLGFLREMPASECLCALSWSMGALSAGPCRDPRPLGVMCQLPRSEDGSLPVLLLSKPLVEAGCGRV